MDYQKILAEFGITNPIISTAPFGSGHINDTFKITVDKEGNKIDYILQRINTDIFTRPDILMDNAVKVTEYLSKLYSTLSNNKTTIHFYPTTSGSFYTFDEDGRCWRLEDLIPNTTAYDLCTSTEMFEKTGYAFGSFMNDLADFPASELGEIIPNFHNTKVRFEAFVKAVNNNLSGRKNTCLPEIEFALARKDLAETLVNQIDAGTLPLRVTHNDTKINNILMDIKTNDPVAIIDLDTIMPGACAYDFGDSIRFGASSAEEDEKDLNKVFMRLDLFKAYTKGYLNAVGKTMTQSELQSLAIGSIIITFETGIRFLGDYLDGDTYFKTAYPEHNLVRARTQFKLVADMEEKLEQMNAIVAKYAND